MKKSEELTQQNLEVRKAIGERLKTFLENTNMNQSKLSKIMDVYPSTITQVIQGKIGLNSEKLMTLVYQGCDLNWLLTGKRLIMDNSQKNIASDNSVIYGKVKAKEVRFEKDKYVIEYLESKIEALKNQNSELKKQIEELKLRDSNSKNSPGTV